MQRYLKVDENLIKVDSVVKVEFVSDDIYLGIFPVGYKDGLLDYIPFTYARLVLNTGEVVDLNIDLYVPEEGEKEDDWIVRNRSYINKSLAKIEKALGEIIDVEGVQYEY